MDCERHLERLGGGEDDVVVGMAERPPVMREGCDVRTAPSVEGKPRRLSFDCLPPISSSSRPFSSRTMRSARSRYCGSRYVSHKSGGSRMWPSASTACSNESRCVSCIGLGMRDLLVERE